MGLRSRDSIARANGVVNERAARKGLRGLKTTFRGKRRRARDDDDDDDATGTATGRRGVRGGGARIKWPDQASASDVRAPEEEEEEGEAGTRARGGGAEATTTARGDGDGTDGSGSRARSSSTSKRLPLETLIEYEVTEREGSLEKFERRPSAGAGRFAGAYEDDDSDDSFDTEEDVRAMREAMRDLKYGDDDDRKCCCVVQ